MKKTYAMKDDKGIYVCFRDYEDETGFDDFLAFVCGKLSVAVPVKIEGPYSTMARIAFKGEALLVMYHPDTGCSVRVPLNRPDLENQIVELCYGTEALDETM
jgi:hypothetical protein